jgi:hypothetical protein
MIVIIKSEMVSRRNALSRMGLAAAVLTLSDADAQTTGMERRRQERRAAGAERLRERRTARAERRQERRTARTERREERRTGTTIGTGTATGTGTREIK